MDERPYLTPAELDFRRDESVTALGDGRYVVATDAASAATARGPDAATGRTARDPNGARTDRRRSTETGRLDTDGGVSVRRPEAESTSTPRSEPSSELDSERRPESGTVESSATAVSDRDDYFADLRVRTDEGTFEASVEGDDIGEVFASMLRWYARRVSPDDDPKEVVSILLSRSEL